MNKNKKKKKKKNLIRNKIIIKKYQNLYLNLKMTRLFKEIY